MSHDWIDTALGIAGIAGPCVGFMVARYLGNIESLRKEIRDLRSDTANIRGHLNLPSWHYE
jgi:hypothetical protein